MKDYLFQKNKFFEKISLNKITLFVNILKESKYLDINYVGEKFERYETNYKEIIELFYKLKYIKVTNNRIVLFNKIKKIIKYNRDELKDHILNELIKVRNPYFNYIKSYLINFEKVNNEYIYKPIIYQSLKYCGIRNLLIEFGVLSNIDNKYVFSKKYSYIFDNQFKILSPKAFKRNLLECEKIGMFAEKLIIKYEKNVLHNYPQLVNKIEHTALFNVNAGYDIVSYEKSNNKIHKEVKKFIEVKTVSEKDLAFYWSKNEINTAKIFAKQYFLYLLPVITQNKIDTKKLIIIRDPYKYVYKNKNNWIGQIELYNFIKINENKSIQ